MDHSTLNHIMDHHEVSLEIDLSFVSDQLIQLMVTNHHGLQKFDFILLKR